jgi:hypothetical protein
MDDASFIIGLMKTETDALGFIPAPAIRSRWIPKGRYIIQRDRRGRRRGYLLHGPARPGRELFVNQVCIEHDYRLKGHAWFAVRELFNRAHAARCTAINLRCAADLSANWFWLSVGFTLIDVIRGGQRRDREISVYRMKLPTSQIHVPTPQSNGNWRVLKVT